MDALRPTCAAAPASVRHPTPAQAPAPAPTAARPGLAAAHRAFDAHQPAHAACLRTAAHLLAEHRLGELLDCLDRLDADLARGADWHLARAEALWALRDARGAVREASAALAKAGADTALHQHALLRLGQGLTRLEEHAEAAWCHRMALAARPAAADAALAAAIGNAADLDWDALPDGLDRLVACAQAPVASALAPLAMPIDPSRLAHLLDHPPLQRWLATLACAQRHGHGATRARPARPVRERRPGRWRIGVLAGGRDCSGPVLEPAVVALLDGLDPTRFTLQVYADDHAAPPPGLAAAGWHATRHASPDALAERIQGEHIDLLLDLSGPGEASRLGVLARRPAPLQAVWLGHAGTTGAPWVDYLIGDPVLTPLDARAQFSECIAQLPGHYRPLPANADATPDADTPTAAVAAPTRAEVGLPATGAVLACFHPPEHTTPAQFHAWCQILAAVPGAVLWLQAPGSTAGHRLRARLAAAGLDPARLVFAPKVPAATHLARLPLADLVLDAFPGHAEAAARDALRAGVPVLTRLGQGLAARRTASLLAAFGLPALVCTDEASLVATATHLLRDAEAMARLRARLAEIRAHPGQGPTASELAHLLVRMLARHDAGLPPTPLAAEPAPWRD